MLSEEKILTIIGSELSLADIFTNDATSSELETALEYYLGKPNGKEVEGFSHVTSTDVADAIEWIMPQVMKSFTQNNEIVVFDPVFEGDEQQAELESEYVYEVLMKQNDGFIILYQFVKDALMQRNGILKVYYAKETKVRTFEYTGIGQDQMAAILSEDSIEVIEQSEYIDHDKTKARNQQIEMQIQQLKEQQGQEELLGRLELELQTPVMGYDVKFSVTREKGKICVDPVPPEEFRINSSHQSVNPDGARFTSHVTLKTASEIKEEYGLSDKDIKELSAGGTDHHREYRREQQNESYDHEYEGSGDDSQRLIEVAESYMLIDIDEDGIAEYCKIDTVGGTTPSKILLKEKIDHGPWVATTAFIMSHNFQGLSIYDRLKEIQDQKTTLWRNMFDNIYLQNNQRNKVIESQVNMDDLLVSRPGGVVRVKRQDAIEPMATPQLGQDAYNMMDYLDRVRAGRVGVDPDGNATPQNIGDRVGSQGVERLMNAKEELVGLIIRVIAETGMKPLCIKIRDLCCQHFDAIHDFRFRGVWYKINPTEWPERTRCTVRVGTGTGNHQLQVAALGQVMEIQKLLVEQPGQILVNPKKTFDTIDDFCKFSGLNGAVRYFVDPESPEGKQAQASADQQMQEEKQKQDQMEQIVAKSQLDISRAETVKAQAQYENVRLNNEIDQLKSDNDRLKLALETASDDEDRKLKKYEVDQKTAVELTRIEKDSQKDENQNFQQNKESVNA